MTFKKRRIRANHSGTLAAEYMATNPTGIKSIVFAGQRQPSQNFLSI